MGFLKENIISILLIILIIAVLGVLGIFLYKTVVDNSKSTSETEQNLSNEESLISDANVINILEEKEDNTVNNVINTQKNLSEVDPRLIEIANIFNNSKLTQEMKSMGYTMNATVIGNRITVSTSGDGLTFNTDFWLNNNILSADITVKNISSTINLMLGLLVIDSVGQMKGYSENTLISAFENKEFTNYTIENEGLELKQLDNGHGISMKIDLNNNFPFL